MLALCPYFAVCVFINALATTSLKLISSFMCSLHLWKVGNYKFFFSLPTHDIRALHKPNKAKPINEYIEKKHAANLSHTKVLTSV